MADEGSTNDRGNETGESAEGSDLASTLGKLGSAERFLAAGAGILVVDYLLFELILAEYFFSSVTLLAAVYVLFALWLRHNRPAATWPLPYQFLLRVLGFSAGFLGLTELLADIRLDFLNEGVEVFGALVFYAGAFLMFWGAFQMKDTAGS